MEWSESENLSWESLLKQGKGERQFESNTVLEYEGTRDLLFLYSFAKDSVILIETRIGSSNWDEKVGVSRH